MAIVHDYLTQRGGAERVVLAMARAFPGAPIHTSLYDPAGTFPEFASLPVRPGPLQKVPGLRHRHRLALPALALAFGVSSLAEQVVLCSSSGWAHGVRTTGRKVVYCHAPARWLYQGPRYLGDRPGAAAKLGLAALAPALRRWDRRAARSADRYLTNSTAVRDRVWATYGIEAEVLPPPQVLDPADPMEPVPDLEPGFLLCVSRLLPYKNVDAVVEAVKSIPGARLVIVGAGPEEKRLRAIANPGTVFLGRVGDGALRWCYANCAAVVAASFEDYGLTPVEANRFGKPAATLQAGGFIDTVIDGTTGVFFERPTPTDIGRALGAVVGQEWDAEKLRAHAARFSEEAFARRLREVVAEEAGGVPAP